jgi:hypothetical protein
MDVYQCGDTRCADVRVTHRVTREQMLLLLVYIGRTTNVLRRRQVEGVLRKWLSKEGGDVFKNKERSLKRKYGPNVVHTNADWASNTLAKMFPRFGRR